MDRKDCVEMFSTIDNMDRIRDERKRLNTIINSEAYAVNKQWHWMENWIKKSDEEHLKENMSISNYLNENNEDFTHDDDHIDEDYCCSICFKPSRYLLHTSFSFCREYGCGMNLCKECATKLGELARQMKDD